MSVATAVREIAVERETAQITMMTMTLVGGATEDGALCHKRGRVLCHKRGGVLCLKGGGALCLKGGGAL